MTRLVQALVAVVVVQDVVLLLDLGAMERMRQRMAAGPAPVRPCMEGMTLAPGEGCEIILGPHSSAPRAPVTFRPGLPL